jgi:hypothetical protein
MSLPIQKSTAKKPKPGSLSIQKSVAKTASLLIEKSVAKNYVASNSEIDGQNCVSVDLKISSQTMPLPIQKLVAMMELFRLYLSLLFFRCLQYHYQRYIEGVGFFLL